MSKQDSVTKSALHDWVDGQTRRLDVVASFESLCETYDVLRFTDPITDATRLEEYKWIIKEMNKFLTRMRTSLFSAVDLDAAIKVLRQSFTPSGQVNIESRKALAFQKLRQRWIMQMLAMLETMKEGVQDGWPESGTDGESGERDFY